MEALVFKRVTDFSGGLCAVKTVCKVTLPQGVVSLLGILSKMCLHQDEYRVRVSWIFVRVE